MGLNMEIRPNDGVVRWRMIYRITVTKINPIDNEISQIANTIDNFNKLNSINISYTSLHFATDYLKSRKELDKQVELNLSNNRCELAKSCKEVVTKKIISLLLEYLSMK